MTKPVKKSTSKTQVKTSKGKSAKLLKENTKKSNDKITSVSTFFRKMKDDLRHSDDHITGRDAVIMISQLVTLYLLHKQNRLVSYNLKFEIDFDKLYKQCTDPGTSKHLDKISQMRDEIFGELAENENTTHAFSIIPHYRKGSTFIMMVKTIYEFFESMDDDELSDMKKNDDILGKEYEELLKTQLVGRDDGQYFTNRTAVKFIIDQIDPQIGETVYDPSCGTGGFLIYAFLYMKKQIKDKNLSKSTDYKKLTTNTLFGCDIDHKVLGILHSNLVLHNIKHNDQFKACNTLKDHMVYDKHDVVVSNYPFGKKGAKIFNDVLEDTAQHTYFGFSSNTLPLLFIKHTINILKDGGRAGVIVTTGELSNRGKDYDFYRTDLVKNNTLKKVIMLPTKIFENAKGVSTAVLIFNKGGRTTEVEFSRVVDVDFKKVEIIKKVTYAIIKKNNYILDPNMYIAKETVDYGDIPMMKLGDVCKFLPKSSRKAAEGLDEGTYSFYTSSKTVKKIDEADYSDECIIIGTGGVANIKFDKNFSCSADNFIMTTINSKKYLIKYIYYYLFNNINLLEDGFKGVTIKHINKDYVTNIEIPMPSIETQKKIIDKMIENESIIRKYEKSIQNVKKSIGNILNDFLVDNKNDQIEESDFDLDVEPDAKADKLDPSESDLKIESVKSNKKKSVRKTSSKKKPMKKKIIEIEDD